MIYAPSIIAGILLLLLYYNRLDVVERKYNFQFVRKNDSNFPRFQDVWAVRKTAENKGLRKYILFITLIRALAFIALWGTFLYFFI